MRSFFLFIRDVCVGERDFVSGQDTTITTTTSTNSSAETTSTTKTFRYDIICTCVRLKELAGGQIKRDLLRARSGPVPLYYYISVFI